MYKNLNSDGFNTGDESAIKYLFETLSPRAVVFAQSIVKDTEPAKDIVQTVFTKLWCNKMSFDTINHFKTYLYNSVKNACINHIEKNRKLSRETVDIPQSTIESNIIETEMEAEIYRQINSLPKARKEVILNKMKGMTVEDIAVKLGVSKATVKTHLILAKKDLKAKLGKNAYFLIFFNI